MNNYEFAINLEKNGEEYYNKRALENTSNGLGKVFQLMAKDERKHAALLRERFEGQTSELIDDRTLEKSLDIFAQFSLEEDKRSELLSQSDAYQEALEKENQSIELYKGAFNEASDDATREFFEFLIKEEMNHKNILEEMIVLINRPYEWIESPEFGNRGQYWFN